MSAQTYSFGYDPETSEFILWKRGRRTPVAFIPRDEAEMLVDTVQHVTADQRDPSCTCATKAGGSPDSKHFLDCGIWNFEGGFKRLDPDTGARR